MVDRTSPLPTGGLGSGGWGKQMSTVRQMIQEQILTLDGWIQECWTNKDKSVGEGSAYWRGRKVEAEFNRDQLIKIQSAHYDELRGNITVTKE